MYKLIYNSNAIQRADGWIIPADHSNADYAVYLKWVAEGNTPDPADPIPVPVITSVSMRQARLALLQAGLLSQVEAALLAIPNETERQAAQIEWEYATAVDKNSPWVQNLSSALNLTEQQLQDLFDLASTL